MKLEMSATYVNSVTLKLIKQEESMLNKNYLDPLLQMNIEQPGFLKNLISIYKTTSNLNIENLKSALVTNDLHKLKKEAHSLKSSSLSLGLEEVSNLCLFLEKEALIEEDNSFEFILKKIERKNTEGICELQIILESELNS